MASTINGTSTGNGGLISTGDDSGILNIQTNETTAITVDASQRVAFVAGTAALPSITTAGDTNTGIFFPAADTIAFSEGGAESMRIDSSGNVMVGATSSNYRLRVQGAVTDVGEGDTNVLQGLVSTTAQAAGVGPSLLFVATYDSGSGLAGMGSIAGIKENSTSGNYAGALKFMTRPNGGNLTERMRIDSSGNLLVGTTTNQGAGVTISGVQGNSFWFSKTTSSTGYNHLVFCNPNGNVGFIQTSGSGTSFLTSSDYRLKENIAPMTGALSKVAQLNPVTYKWKVDGSDGQGFIAHELQAIVPDCVTGEKDEVDADGNPVYQGIDTSFLVATLTAALQETKALIDTQAETINAQSEAIASLTARIVALEGQ